MPFPPLWKVGRELDRIRVKLVLLASRHLYEPIRKPIYDLTARRRQRLTPGNLPLTDRVAVFLVYQPGGVARSIFLTLDHLRQNGFSVLVVSNGPLRPEDRDTLAAQAALVMERPNVGYDFGAYRDGIRHLWSLNHAMSRLVLMNDSTWFPLRRDDDSLARMEALGADLAGHIFKTEEERSRKHDHMESHLLMISQRFLQSDAFRSFWSRYAMSDHRATTIKYGEKGFSQTAIRSGMKLASLMGREWLLATLRGLDDAELRVVFDMTNDSYRARQKNAAHIRDAAARGLPWRDDFLNWVDKALRSSRTFLISSTFVAPALIYGRMGFAKKANDIRFHMAREELLELEARGMIPPLADEVHAEVSQMVRTWVPPKGAEHVVRQRTQLPAHVGQE